MDIAAVINPSQILCNLSPDLARDELLKKLADTFVDNGVLTDVDEYVEAVLDREDDMTTQTCGGIAIPHASTDSVRKLSLAIGIVKQPGMVYDPDESECCQVIFLIAIPAEAPGSHLHLLSHLAKLIMANKTEAMKSATTSEDIMDILTQP